MIRTILRLCVIAWGESRPNRDAYTGGRYTVRNPIAAQDRYTG